MNETKYPELLFCYGCSRQMPAWRSHSDDFCSEDCQERWDADRSVGLAAEGRGGFIEEEIYECVQRLRREIYLAVGMCLPAQWAGPASTHPASGRSSLLDLMLSWETYGREDSG